MKKAVCILLTVIMLLGSLAGCGGKAAEEVSLPATDAQHMAMEQAGERRISPLL